MARDAHGAGPRLTSQDFNEGTGAGQSFTNAMKSVLSVSKSEIVALEKKAKKKKK
jgi:hypothetical protein